MSNITYHSLSDYVGGKCISKTFELDHVTFEVHQEEISEWLTSITKERKDGEIREEWIVCDYEDIPHEYVGEYHIDESFFHLMSAIDNSHYDAEVFHAGVSLGLSIENIEDNYFGYFSDKTELGEMCADGLEIPDNIQPYFDYEAYGRACSYDFMESDGHYFFNH